MTAVRTVAVTGADGFIGRNLLVRLGELAHFAARPITRATDADGWRQALDGVDAVVHLAGINRPQDPADFAGNQDSVQSLVGTFDSLGRSAPVILTSSAKAGDGSPYGVSKEAAEAVLADYGARTGAPVAIFRLPNVFGKWCRPNYNSGVATFCHNIARGLPITVNDPAAPLSLIYVDDFLDTVIAMLNDGFSSGMKEAAPVYRTTVGEVSRIIEGFRSDRDENLIANVGSGLCRALYATYVSYLPPDQFSYKITAHRDPRGAFSEMLKTRDAGQFSYFTAHPGVTRGGHYHHTKTEKFLIVHGEALFRFRHLLTDETCEIRTSGQSPEIVETIPGWAHDVTNVGAGEMVSLLWANEIFDRDRPDTVWAKL